MVTLRNIADLAIAGTIVMVLFAALIMQQFSDSYNPSSCVSTGWVNNTEANNQSSGVCWEEAQRSGGNIVPNTSVIAECTTQYVSCCRYCTNWGWRDTARGLLLFTFALLAIGIGVRFIVPRM